MTKKEYIWAHPKTTLAAELRSINWPDEQKVYVIGGLNTPTCKRSNLYAALLKCNSTEYIVGAHRRRGTEGWWMAVRDNR